MNAETNAIPRARERRASSVRGLVGLLLAVACSQQPAVVPVRNLERPSDMGFVCVREEEDPQGGLRASARPISSCRHAARERMGKDDSEFFYEELPVTAERHQRVAEVHPRRPRTRGTYGLVTSTARGEVAVLDLDLGRIVDLDRAQFGYNLLPVGRMPETIDVSTDGCQAVTVNRASCDFSLIDTTRLLSSLLAGAPTPSTGAGPVTATFVAAAETPSGETPLEVAPQEAVFVPTALDDAAICQAKGMTMPGGDVRPRRLIATFPACDLVALLAVPLESGEGGRPAHAKILDSVRIRTGAVERTGRNPTCPRQCGGGSANGDLSGAGAGADGGTGATVGLGLGPLAVEPRGRFLYVGALGAPLITVLQIDGEQLTVPVAPQLTLAEGAGGISRLRLSVDPFDIDTEKTATPEGERLQRVQGRFVGKGRLVGEGHKFLYAFARDGSVRVLNVAPRIDRVQDQAERECDVNVEPEGNSEAWTKGCFPLDGVNPGKPWRRRPFADGPGLRIPVSGLGADFPPPLPRDVSFLNLGDDALGYLLSSNGQVYIVQLGDSVRATAGKDVLTHTIRDVSRLRGPKADTDLVEVTRPTRDLSSTSVPFPTLVSFGSAFAGPRIEREESDPGVSEPPNSDSLRFVATPPRSFAGVLSQSWSITWEDSLPGADRVTGLLVTPSGSAGPAFRVEDPGADLCRAGVEPGDALSLVGCLRELDCNPLALRDGPICYQTTPGLPGLCLSRARAKEENTSRTCARELSSRRRYRVLDRTATGLDLGLRLDEIPRPSIAPCQADSDCQSGAPSATTLKFVCREVTPGEPRRCVMPCEKPGEVAGDKNCRTGRVCEDFGSAGPLCVEAPPPSQACWPTQVHYRVQAGQSFLVTGSSAPRPVRAVAGADGRCLALAGRDPRLVERIPLSAPACNDDPKGPGPSIYKVLAGTVLAKDAPAPPNPCLFWGVSRDAADPEVANESRPPHVKALFQNHELRFVLTNLEQYAGDGLSFSFRVALGYVPDRVDASDGDAIVSLGTRILTSPTQPRLTDATTEFFPHVMVIDQGRSAAANSRGQVLRIIPKTPVYPSGRFESRFTGSTFPIQ